MDTKTTVLLEKLEETSDKYWNISHQTGNFISMLIKIKGAKNVLELGTSNGYSGLWIADALKETGGHLTTIEFWEKRQSIARDNIEYCGLQEIVTFKQGQAYDVIREELHEEFDMVFIDANKEEYKRFYEAIDPLLKKGGVILADNIKSHAKKVEPFVQAIKSNSNYQTEILDLPDGLLMAYKKEE